MEKFFSIGKTAEMVGMTAETLRHYDRIGLVHPCKTDEWTGYRYYSEREIVRLHTIHALRCMDLPLHEIKKMLDWGDLEKIIAFLKRAEESADQKIAELQHVKERIGRARRFYEGKASEKPKSRGIFEQIFPKRAILLSNKLRSPTVENLWNYHRHFYEQVGKDRRDAFAFKDVAGIYEAGGQPHMFAICTKYIQTEGLLFLPAGKYLCADCSQEGKEKALGALRRRAKEQYDAVPEAAVCLVVLSGILQWNYQLQLYVGRSNDL